MMTKLAGWSSSLILRQRRRSRPLLLLIVVVVPRGVTYEDLDKETETEKEGLQIGIYTTRCIFECSVYLKCVYYRHYTVCYGSALGVPPLALVVVGGSGHPGVLLRAALQ